MNRKIYIAAICAAVLAAGSLLAAWTYFKEKDDNVGMKLSVTSRSLKDGEAQYTIRYQVPKKVSKKWEALWLEFNGFRYVIVPKATSKGKKAPPYGVFETSRTLKTREGSHLLVNIGYKGSEWLRFYLANSVGQDLSEKNIEIPLLDISSNGDIVYEPGQNATVKILHSIGTLGGKRLTVFNGIFTLAKPESDNVISDSILGEGLFHIKNEHTVQGEIESQFSINTASESYSGLIDFYSGYIKENGILMRVENHKEVVLRPKTQKHPFPDGQIYKSMIGSTHFDEDGESVSYCFNGKECGNQCVFYGNNLTNVELFMTRDGVTTPVELKSYDEPLKVYKKSAFFETYPSPSDPFPVRYTCKVKDVNGDSSTYRSILKLGNNTEILDDGTSITLFNNGITEIKCSATGAPLPTLIISCDGIAVSQKFTKVEGNVVCGSSMCSGIGPNSTISCAADNSFNYDYHLYNTAELTAIDS